MAAQISLDAPAHSACLDAANCAALKSRFAGLLLVDPATDRAEKRLNDQSWSAPAWSGAPMQVTSPSLPAAPATDGAFTFAGTEPPTTADGKVAVQTSVRQWAAYSAKTTTARLEATAAARPELFKLPPVYKPDPRVDVWFALDTDQASASRASSQRLGADYKIGKIAVVGLAAQTEEKDAGQHQTQALASYFAIRPFSAVTLDGRAGMAETLSSGPIDGNLDAAQRFLTTRIRADWMMGQVKVSPALTFAHGDETLKERAAAAAPQHEVNRLAFAPRVSRPVDIGDNTRLEPFVTLDRKLTMSADETLLAASGAAASDTSIGAGINLTRKESYSLELGASLEGVDKEGPASVKSRLQLKVPLR